MDLEKAFDKVPRPRIRWALGKQEVPESLIRRQGNVELVYAYDHVLTAETLKGVESMFGEWRQAEERIEGKLEDKDDCD